MFTRGRRRPDQLQRRAGQRPWLHARAAGRAGSAACPRPSASCRSRRSPRRSRPPGEGQIRAMLTLAGNPAVSTPDSERLDRALGSLDFMVSLDVYVNETTRHADVILPGHLPPAPLPLRRRPLPARGPQRRQLLGAGARARPGRPRRVADDPPPHRHRHRPGAERRRRRDRRLRRRRGGPARARRRRAPGSEGRDAGRDRSTQLEGRNGPERLLDLLLRAGPYGDRFGEEPDGLTLERLEEAPHGIDLGPLEPAAARRAANPERQGRAGAGADRRRRSPPRRRRSSVRANGGMVLVGRRQLRSNNSWMHNVPRLVSGPPRCTAHVHPEDAERLGLSDGERAPGSAPTRASIEVPVEVTDARDARRGQHPARLGPRRRGRRAESRPRARRLATATCSPART